MTDKELQDLIEQLSQQRSQKPGAHSFGQDPIDPMQATRGGLSPQEEYVKWAWNPANVFVGGNVPLAVQGISQRTGRMNSGPGSPVGGFTPEFAQQVNQALFPNVRPVLYGQGGYGTNEAPGALMGENALQNLIGQEKQRMTPDGYQLSPEEEKTIEDALRKRYGR